MKPLRQYSSTLPSEKKKPRQEEGKGNYVCHQGLVNSLSRKMRALSLLCKAFKPPFGKEVIVLRTLSGSRFERLDYIDRSGMKLFKKCASFFGPFAFDWFCRTESLVLEKGVVRSDKSETGNSAQYWLKISANLEFYKSLHIYQSMQMYPPS